MKWLIKPTLLEKSKMQSIMRMLDIAGIKYDEVHTANGVMYTPEKEVYVPDLNEKNFVCGSYQLALAMHKLQPSSVFLLEDYSFKDWYEIFGKENMLNPNVQFAYPKDIVWQNDEMFVRPLHDTKSFNGGVYSAVSEIPNVECLVAPLQQIQKEFRFFVLNGEIIAASQYKMNGELCVSSIIDKSAESFANEMIKRFQFPGYVIDIAVTNDRCSVVELNCFNASGFYEIDLYRFINKIIDFYE